MAASCSQLGSGLGVRMASHALTASLSEGMRTLSFSVHFPCQLEIPVQGAVMSLRTQGQGYALDFPCVSKHTLFFFFLLRRKQQLGIGVSELRSLVTGLLVSQIIFICAIKKNDLAALPMLSIQLFFCSGTRNWKSVTRVRGKMEGAMSLCCRSS